MRFRLLTVLWGDAFVDRFLRITLRSLLATGNLPALAARGSVTFALYTTPTDAARIRENPLFARAAEIIDFQIHTFSLSEIDSANPYSHWTLWERGFAEAQDADEWVITVAGDHLFSNGTLTRWADLFDAGRLAIFSPGIQVAMETIEEELASRFSSATIIDLSLEQTMDLMFRHLHPVNISMFRNSPRWMTHPEYNLRPLPGVGFTQNILTSHAVAFHSTKIRMSANFCPLEKLDRIAFEPCRFLSVEPLLKNLPLYFRPWRMDDATLTYFGQWGHENFSPANIRECSVTHTYSIQAEPDAASKRNAVIGARFYVLQMLTSRAIFRLLQFLQSLGLTEAALWLAVGHAFGRLRRRLPVPDSVTVFVPDNGVLMRLEPQERVRLLASDGAGVARLCRAHTVAQHVDLKAGDRLAEDRDGGIRTQAGSRFRKDARGRIRVLRGPLVLDSILVYVVNRPLAPLRIGPKTMRHRIEAAINWARHRFGRLIAHVFRASLTLLRRSHRSYVLIRNLRDRLQRRLRPSLLVDAVEASRASLSDEVRSAFQHALAERALSALQDIYATYEDQVLAGTQAHSAPARKLRQLGTGTDGLQLLRRVLQEAPFLSEAWLELGYACLAAGDEKEAMSAFERARSLAPVLPLHRGEADPRLLAAISLAELLIKQERFSDALNALDAAIAFPPVPWRCHLMRARLLLQLGRPREAMFAFEKSLVKDQVTPKVYDLPQTLHVLEQRLQPRAQGRVTAAVN